MMTQPPVPRRTASATTVTMELHPQEAALIRYLRQLRFGRLERLEVQDGLPVGAEEVRGRVRFDGRGGRGGSSSSRRRDEP